MCLSCQFSQTGLWIHNNPSHVETEKVILKFIWECKGARIAERRKMLESSHYLTSVFSTDLWGSIQCGIAVEKTNRSMKQNRDRGALATLCVFMWAMQTEV